MKTFTCPLSELLITQLKRTQQRMIVLMLFLAFGTFGVLNGQTTYTSTANTTWSAMTWSPAGTPSATDNVIINHNVTADVLVSVNNLTLNASKTLLTSASNFVVNGTSSISGTFKDNLAGGEIVFNGAVTINTGGRIDNNAAVAGDMEFKAGIVSNGTIALQNSSTAKFSSANQSISGPGSITIANILVQGDISLTNGSTNASGIICTDGLDGTSTNSTFVNNTGATLTYRGSNEPMLTAGILNASLTGNTVNYNGSVQTIKSTTYFNLSYTAAGAKTTGDITVLGSMTRTNGTLTFTGVQIFSGSVSGSLNTNTTLTFSEILISKAGATLTLLNNNIITTKLTISAGTFAFGNTARTITLSDDLAGAGILDMTGAAHILNLGGANNTIGSLLTDANASRINYNRTGDQEIFNSLNYQSLYVSGSGTKSISGAIKVAGNLNFNSSGSYFLSLGNNTLKIASTGTLTGTFSANRHIITDGTGFLVKEATSATDFRADMVTNGIYPVGSGGYYTPFNLTSLSATVTGTAALFVRAVPTRQPNIPYFNNALTKHWVIETTNMSAINANVSFNFNTAEVIGSVALYSPRVWDGSTLVTPSSPSAPGSNPFTSTGTNFLAGSWSSLDPTVRSALYSYQSGDWNSASTWTTDPSGNTLVSPMVPQPGDQVIILNGRTVTNTGAATTIGSLTINGGGVLDLGASSGHVFGPISGEGRLRLSTQNLPNGNYNNFVASTGGTIEYYSTGSTSIDLPSSQTTYNNLEIKNYLGTTMEIAINHNITVNGNLIVSKSSTGATNLTVGTTAGNRTLNILKDAQLGTGCSWLVGTNNSTHSIVIQGNLVNSGTIDFTNGADYATTTNGVANIHFQGTTANTSITLNSGSSTTFYGFQSTKLVGYQLSVSASSSSTVNFVNKGNTFSANGSGILRFGANITIPVMIGGGGGNFDLGGTGALPTLWIDGASITDGGVSGAIVPYGTIKVSSGSLTCENGQKAVVIRESGALEIEGGTVRMGLLRTSVTAVTHRGSFFMSGGTLNLTGDPSAEAGYYSIFSLPYPENVFKMYGGTITITRQANGGITRNGGFMVASSIGNYEVTGGTVNFNTTGGVHFDVSSTTPLYNVNIGRSTAGAGEVRLNAIDWSYSGSSANTASIPAASLVVLNNLVIQSSNTPTLNAGDQDIIIGNNMTISTGGNLISGNNAIQFNSSGAQLFTIDGATTFNSTGGSNLINGPENITPGANFTFERTTSTSDAEVSPTGTITGEKISETTANGEHRIYTPFIPTAGPVTSSIFVKPNGRTCVALSVGEYNARGIAWFNLTGAGSVISTNGNVLAATITAAANGWYRITATANGNSQFRVRLNLGNGSCTMSYAGNESMGVFAWGLKVEGGLTASAYQSSSNVGINSLVLNKVGASTLTIAGSTSTLDLNGSLSVNSGLLATGTKILNVKANVTNNTSISNSGVGKIRLNGTSPQVIHGGGAGIFTNLMLDNTGSSAGAVQIYATANFVVNTSLVLNSDRLFNIQNNKLSLTANATITPGSSSFGVNKFIKTTGFLSDGGISKDYSVSATSFLFPFGSGTNYTPSSIAFASAPTTYGTLNVRPVAAQQLYVTNPSALNYYWKVNQTGFTGIPANSMNLTFNYGNLPDNTAYIPGYYNFQDIAYTTVNDVNAVNESSKTISFLNFNKLEGDFTAGIPAAFGTVVPYYSRATGNWNTPATWSNTGHGGLVSSTIPNDHVPVFIGDGSSYNHTVSVTTDNTLAGSLLIGAGSTLDLGVTIGNNFGALPYSTAGGSGNIKISSAVADAVFPAGDFGLFFQPTGGTTEYYSTTSNFTIPLVTSSPTLMDIPTYRRLKFTPSASYRIAFPSRDILVYEDVTINGAASTAEVNLCDPSSQQVQINGNLVLNGGMLRIRSAEPQTLNVLGNISVSSGARIDAVNAGGIENRISLNGNLTNNGIIDFDNTSQIILDLIGSSAALLDGTDPAAVSDYYLINVDKGTDETIVTELTTAGSITTPAGNWLNLVHGTFRISKSGSLTLNNSTNLAFNIPPGTKLSVNHTGAVINIAQHNSNGSDLIVGGTLELLNGAVNIGSATNTAHNDLEYSTTGTPTVDVRNNSMLSVNGQVRRSVYSLQGSLRYLQSGNSTVLVRGRNPEGASSFNLDRAKFEIVNPNSLISMSGNSMLIIDRSGVASSLFGDIYLTPANFNMTGGKVVIGTGNTPSNSVFSFVATSPFYDLTIDGTTTNKFVNNTTNATTILNDFIIEGNSEYRANGLDLSIGGDFTNTHTSSGIGLNTGGFKPGTAAQNTYFNSSTGNQTISGFASNLTNFSNLIINNTFPTGQIELTANSNIRVNGSLTMTSGNVSLQDNTMTVIGNISSNIDMFTGTGFLSLAGSNNQVISGDGTASFGNISLANAAGAELSAPITINGIYNINQGILYINNYLLTFGESASVSGTANSNMMIRLNGVVSDAGVKKLFPASASSFNFPIGTTLKYTPASYSIASNSVAGSITVKPVNVKHPATTDAIDKELKYYWNAVSSGFSGGASFNHMYNYFTGDAIYGTETSYVTGRYFNNVWTPVGGIASTVNAAQDKINLTAVNYINGDYTAGETTEFGIIQTYFSRNATLGGNWNDVNSWSTDALLQHAGAPATIAPDGKNIVIAAGHTISVTNNAKNAPTSVIEGTLSLSNTFGHNFGVTSGTGKIVMNPSASNTFIFPGGDYSVFTSINGGTFEYQSNTNSIIPTQGIYNNVTFSGSGAKYLPNADILVNGNFSILAGSVSTTWPNRQISLKGDWLNQVGQTGFSLGNYGKLYLIGNNQSLSGSTSFTFLIIDGVGVKELNSSMNCYHLTLNSGIIKTNANQISVASNGSITGGSASSYVNGNLVRSLPSGAISTVFPIGDETRYTPIEIVFSNPIASNGSISARTDFGDDVNMYLSGLNENKSVNRTYQLNAYSIIGFGTYSAKFHFNAADVDPAANTNNLVASRYESSIWTLQTSTTNFPTSTQINGLTSFGKFQLAEQLNGIVWTGNVNTNWNLAANWQPNAVPTSSDDIFIGLVTNQPNINVGSNGVCKDITMNSGVVVSVPNTHNLSISGNVFSTNATFSGLGKVIFNANNSLLTGSLLMKSNMEITAGAILSLDNSSNLEFTRDLIATGQLNLNQRPVTCSGAQSSLISGAPINFENLTVNKTSENLELKLAVDANINGNLTLLSGDVNLNGRSVSLGTTGMLVGETALNRVYGTSGTISSQRILNNITDENIAGLGVILTSASNLGLTTVNRGHQQRVFNAGFGIDRYYDIHPANNVNLDATMKFNYFEMELGTALGTIQEAELDLWRFDGAYWNVQWATLDGLNNQLVKTNIPEFSTWTAGSRDNNALPITLINFDGECMGSMISIEWSTASESNNKVFFIEESDDAKNWSMVKSVEGAGNSTTQKNYSELISSKYANGSYFRLTQVDFNGNSERFSPIFVNCEESLTNEVSISPNPAIDFVNVSITSTEEMETKLTLFSSNGQILFTKSVSLRKGANSISLNISDLPSGAYHLNIANDRKIEISGSRSIIKR
jgi:hypothetical protein